MSFPMVKDVDTIDAMATEKFGGPISAVRVPRTLTGDFQAVAARLLSSDRRQMFEGTKNFTHEDMQKEFAKARKLRHLFSYNAQERQALSILESDMNALAAHRYDLLLRVVDDKADKESGTHRFHQDENPMDLGALYEVLLCCYTGATTEFISHEDAIQQGYSQFFTARKGGSIFRFDNGDIWKHATGSGPDLKSFIHRSPEHDKIRLLLVCSRVTPRENCPSL